ncbi:MAG: hypothetical protein AAF193_02230 [Bacteroidota bacterium]
MKKNQKELDQLAKRVKPIEENQYGILSGGFSSFAGSSARAAAGTNTNNAVGCTCSTNKSCLCIS